MSTEAPKYTTRQWRYVGFMFVAAVPCLLWLQTSTYPPLIALLFLAFGAEVVGVRLRWATLTFVPLWLLILAFMAMGLWLERGVTPALLTLSSALVLLPLTWVINRARDARREAARMLELHDLPLSRLDPRGDYGWEQLAEQVFVPRLLEWSPEICDHNRQVTLVAQRWLTERGVTRAVSTDLAQILSVFVAGARDSGAIDEALFTRSALSLRYLIETRGR